MTVKKNSFFSKIKFFFLQKYERMVLFFDHFLLPKHLRFLVEIFDMALNFGLVVFFILIIFAYNAFNIVDEHQDKINNISAIFLDKYGTVIGRRGATFEESVPIDELPDYFIKAVLATEDRRFFQHWGIDLIGIVRALIQNSKAHGIVQGGSTLTQQLAKNIYLNNEKTLSRKINEAFIALWLEVNLSKRAILEKYLNSVYMGAGNYGVEAASLFYFNKDARSISLNEAAMLAGLFKAPSAYAPSSHVEAAVLRANTVLSNLVDKGFMTESEVEHSRQKPAIFVPHPKENNPEYFIDWAYKELQTLNKIHPFKTLPVVVKTTLDPTIQNITDRQISSTLNLYGKNVHATQAAAVVIARDGSVNAIVGGKDYEKSQYNRATTAQRQTGSSFKVYVYTTLLERTNLTPESKVYDGPFNWGGWSPRNYGRRYHGWVSLEDAVVYSLNTVPPYVTSKYLYSTAPIIETAQSMGVTSRLDTNRAMVLGTSGMTVMEQAVAYNVLSNGGVYGTAHSIQEIRDPEGKELWNWKYHHPPFNQAISTRTARLMNQILVQVVERGTGTHARLPMTKAAGKSGTSQEYRDAWFAGFTGNYTAVVWMGNDNFSPMSRVTGGTLPALTWNNIMLPIHRNIKLQSIYGFENTESSKNPSLKFESSDSDSSEMNIVNYEMTPVLNTVKESILQRLQDLEKGT